MAPVGALTCRPYELVVEAETAPAAILRAVELVTVLTRPVTVGAPAM